MTTLEKQIYEIISKANGIKGSDIANALQLDKRTVNSTLSQSHALKAVVKQESDYKWYLISSGKSNSKMAWARQTGFEILILVWFEFSILVCRQRA